jgi:hypothetical protein
MIDFKKKVEEIQNKQGYCNLSNNYYSSINGTRTNSITGVETPVKIHWVIEHDAVDKVIYFLNGVTGYEIYSLESLVKCGLLAEDTTDTVCLCSGTKNQYDTLVISRSELQQVVREALTVYK